MIKILFVGDVIGNPGREILNFFLPKIKQKEKIDFIITNGENSAGGMGITPKVAEEIFSFGVDCITLGNHVFNRKEALDIIDDERVVRPANFPSDVPGKGWRIFDDVKGVKIGVVNLMGRVFLSTLDCPFRCSDKILEKIEKETNVIIVDMHAEITSEKIAMGWYLDGKVSACIGTHTHVQTADERVLPQGTAYITDVGMTGPRDSVIGVKKEIILKRYLTQMPIRFEVAKEDLMLAGVIFEIDEKTGKAKSIKRVIRYR